MQIIFRPWLRLCLCLLFWVVHFGGILVAAEPEIKPRLFVGIPTELSSSDLITLSLQASGVAPGNLEAYKRRLLHLQKEFAETEILSGPAPGQQLLLWLHDRLFTRYSELQTRVDVVLDTGVYNCVSSAVIYAIFARDAGLDITGVLTADHSFCAVLVDGRYIDVETTTRYGYDPGNQQQFENSFGQTGFSYVPPGQYHLRENIGIVRLVSLILQNRMSAAERQGRHAEAISLGVERYALSPDPSSRHDLVQSFLNYAAYLNARNEHVSAISFLDRTREQYGRDDTYLHTIQTLVHNAVVQYIQRDDAAAAFELLNERLALGDIDLELFHNYRYIIGDHLGYKIVQSITDPVDISLRLDQLFTDGLINEQRYKEYKISAVLKEANVLGTAGDHYRGLVLIERAITALGSHRNLLQARNVFSHNLAATIHNQAVVYHNSGDYQKALAVVREGLLLIPDNPSLLRLERTILRNMPVRN